MSQSRLIRHAVHGVLLASSIAAFTSVFAADGPPAPAGASAETVIVTGSRIARTEEETPSPVQVMSRDEIEKTGKQDIAEVLRGVGADNQGSIPSAFTAGFATGSAAISLRGLGVNSTLVLVNSRRMPAYGLADDGARTFVDLNSIPLEAVERVEVLKDGASAIYGSDAVGGVVNILLKDSLVGGSFGADGGTSYADDGNMYRVFGSYGFGDLASDRYNVYATMEGSKQESIDQLDRPFLGTHDLRDRGFFDQRQGAVPIPALGGAFSGVTPYGSIRDAAGDATPRINILPCGEVNPTTGLCLYDTIPFIQVQPKQERFNVFTRGQFKFTDTLTGYAELGWFHSYTQAIGTPGGVNDAGVFNPGDPLNPVTAPHTTVLPATHPDNSVGVPKTLSLLTTMLGGRNSNVNSDVSRAIVGLKGNITDDWTFDLGGGYLESNLYRSQTGFVRWPVLQAAINNNTFRVNPALDSPALLAAISPTLRDHDKNSLTLADLTVSGKTFNLPGGPLGVAVGLEWRKEKANTPPVPFTDTGEIVGLGFSAFNADRKIYAGYVEVNAPIVSSVEVDAAYRLDHYSDYGRSTTPKIGIKWTPIQQLAFRGTYSEAFRAPGPTESGNSSSLGFTQFAIITTGDPSVKPETAKSYTGGIVFEPFRDTNVSVDYFKIDRKNEITPADQASIVGNLPVTNQVPFSVVPGLQPRSFLYYDFEGNLATISGPFTNLAKTTTDGLEVDARQGFDLADAGKLELRLLWTHVFSFKKTDASGTEFEYVGTHGPYSLSSAGGTPQDRGSLDATWSKESWSMTGRLNYIGAMSMIDHKNIDYGNDGSGVVGTETGVYQNVAPNAINCGVYYPDGHVPNGNCKIPYFITLDLFGKLSVNDHLDVTGSITNATNKHAPFDPYTYGGLNYNPAFNQEGAVGRFFNLGARYRF